MSSQAISIPHVRQSYSWDCGIACLKMIFKLLNKELSQLEQYMKDIGLEQSVWTVDLAYILSRYQVLSTLYTSHLGVKDDYASVPFYKSKFDKDKVRVEALIGDCQLHGFTCIERQLTIHELSDKMAERNSMLIALVNWNLMQCMQCDTSGSQACLKLCSGLCRCIMGTYQGHFILIVNISISEDKVTFHNPGRTTGPCYCSIEMFNKARTAKGTDEDLLFVEIPK